MTEYEEVSLDAPYSGYYGYVSDETRKKLVSFCDIVDYVTEQESKGNDLYVKVTNGSRKGSIAKLSDFYLKHNFNRQQAHHHSYLYFISSGFKLKFDDRDSEVKIKSSDLVLLKGYQGPTVWVYNRGEKREIPNPKDLLGEEIEVGDMVSIIHRRYSEIETLIGTVTRYSEKGTVWINVIPITKDQEVKEVKAYSANSCMVIDNNIKSRIFKARLASGK